MSCDIFINLLKRRRESILYFCYSLKLEPMSFATTYIAYCTSLSNGGLRVHSNVLTGSVPGYLLGKTAKVNIMKMKTMSTMRAITRMSPGQPPVGSGLSMGRAGPDSMLPRVADDGRIPAFMAYPNKRLPLFM